MNNNYCFLLNVNIEPLVPGINVRAQTEHHKRIALDQVSPELTTWLKSLGVKVSAAEVFRWGLGESGGLHVDNHEGDFVKLNWVYGGAGSTTNWYQKKDPTPKIPYRTVINSRAFFYTFDEVEKVHVQHVEGPCILQVGIPHQVCNSNIEVRHTLSFVPKLEDGSHISMQQAQELFAAYTLT